MLWLSVSNLFHVDSNHANGHLAHFTGQEMEAQGIWKISSRSHSWNVNLAILTLSLGLFHYKHLILEVLALSVGISQHPLKELEIKSMNQRRLREAFLSIIK